MSNLDTAAIIPELDPLVPDALDEVQTIQDQQQPLLDSKTEALAGLALDNGWQVISHQMEKDIADFRSGTTISVDPNADLALIGQKYVVASAIATKLQSYLDQVTNAQKAAAEARNVQPTDGAA